MSRELKIKATVCVMMYVVQANCKKTIKRKMWRKKWFADRHEFSDMKLLKVLKTKYPVDLYNYLRMDASDFGFLLEKVKPYIQKQDTILRESIPAEERLVVTLRFLATGRSYECLKFSAAISPQALGKIIPETCHAIYRALQVVYMKFPASKNEWLEIARGFKKKWQMPNCGGALDGKHIRIKAPPTNGALFYNYKNFYSIVLLALVNADYEFIYIDVGKNGRTSDGGVFDYTKLHEMLENNSINFPPNEENDHNLNFTIIGDEAFALEKNVLKPFPQSVLNSKKRIFNYRLSRARNVVENTFGLVSTKFRILHTAISVSVKRTKCIFAAICVLHNFLLRRGKKYANRNTFDSEYPQNREIRNTGAWKNEEPYEFTSLQRRGGRAVMSEGAINQKQYMDYFLGGGKVPWQNDMVNKGRA